MICLSPQLLIATANAFVGVDRSPGGEQEGALDVRLLQHWGHWSHYDVRSERSSWPIGGVTTTAELADLGKSLDIIRGRPEDGDIFLLRGLERRGFIRAGVVARVSNVGKYSETEPYFDVISIEGDSDEFGQIGGGRTVRIARRLTVASGDLFLRWVELDGFAIKREQAKARNERSERQPVLIAEAA